MFPGEVIYRSNENINISKTSQTLSTERENPSNIHLEQPYGETIESMDSHNNLTIFHVFPQRLLDDGLDSRADDCSTELMDALGNIDSFDKG